MIKIAVWSGPRNISTALMRSFGNRSDTFVTDEPFYGYYLHKTNEKHPMKKTIIKTMDIEWDLIVKFLLSEIPNKKNIWYQKHMAQHILIESNMTWINKMKNVIVLMLEALMEMNF